MSDGWLFHSSGTATENVSILDQVQGISHWFDVAEGNLQWPGNNMIVVCNIVQNGTVVAGMHQQTQFEANPIGDRQPVQWPHDFVNAVACSCTNNETSCGIKCTFERYECAGMEDQQVQQCNSQDATL